MRRRGPALPALLALIVAMGSSAEPVGAETPPADAAEWILAGGYGRTVSLGPTDLDVGYAAFFPQRAWTLGPRLQYVLEGHVSRWFGPNAWTAGVIPIGARLHLGAIGGAAYAAVGVGFVWADLVDLIEIDRRFNFLLQGSVGVPLCVRGRCSWTAEARFLHLSNANTAGRNLGINSVLIVAGYRL